VTLATLLLLRQVLQAQQLVVGDPAFRDSARSVLVALDELDQAIAEAEARGEKPCP